MRRVEADASKLCSADAVSIYGEKLICKEGSQRWLHRKTNWLWKFIILVALGLSGMYICISGIEKRVVHHKRLLSSAPYSNNVQETSPCPKLNVTHDFVLHYPQPVASYRDDCSCMPIHYFVIISMQRSGSGWFVTLLNSHPNVTSHGELFSVKRRRGSVLNITRALDAVYDIDWIRSAHENDCTAAVGLKWMLNQGVIEYKREIATYLKDRSVSIIFLFRKNLLRQYISNLANSFDQEAKRLSGKHLAHVQSKEEAKVLAEYKPVVNQTSLVTYLEHVEESINDARVFFKGIRHMTVYYEDLVANPTKELRRAQEFLGVKPIQLESKHVKIHTRPLHDLIDNWDDLNAFLKGSRHEKYLKGNDYR